MKHFGKHSFLSLILFALLFVSACRKSADDRSGDGSNIFRDVPASRLAYNFTPDTEAPAGLPPVAEETKLKPIQDDFDARRKDDRLLRTVVSPDGQRALAVYDTGETQEGEFRLDMYAADGRFLRNLTPPELSGAFAQVITWSPDGNLIAFVGRKSLTPATPPDMIPETAPVAPLPSPTVAPLFAPVPVFNTEQIYVCNRDGFDLRPLTTRDGLIYFNFKWAPDSHAVVALACREDEWEAQERANKQPAGRPRLVAMDGRERLLDDALTEAAPVWSPDASKVATGFETNVKIYDALLENPTQAVIPLRDSLMAASIIYDEKNLESKSKRSDSESNKNGGAPQTNAPPVSFNPIVRLAWPDSRTLFVQTAYIRIYAGEPVNNFQRWHRINLSLQAAARARVEVVEEKSKTRAAGA